MKTTCNLCKWSRDYIGTYRCHHPQSAKEMNLVTGVVTYTASLYNRLDKTSCGPTGKWFEPWWLYQLWRICANELHRNRHSHP